jgi:membrane-associated phospholipid phosphatase
VSAHEGRKAVGSLEFDRVGKPRRTPQVRTTRARPNARDDRLLDLLRRQGPPLILGIIVAIAVLSGIGALVLAVDGIGAWDLDALQWIADHRADPADTLTEWGTWLAETVPIAALTLLTMVVVWLHWRRWAAPMFVAAAVGGEKLIYLLTSIIIGRERPPVETIGDTYATRSFPSGHVASAITLYGSIALLLGLVLGRRWRTVVFVVVAVIAAIVGVCRTYRGFHYPTDVVAGALLGVTWLAFVWSRMRPELVDDEPEPDPWHAPLPSDGSSRSWPASPTKVTDAPRGRAAAGA